jgi:hypothetical protein
MADTITKSSNAYLVNTVEPKIDTIQAKTDSLPNNTGTVLQTIDDFHDVPTADSADNNQMRDVIGNKSDTTGGASLVSRAKKILDRHAVPAQNSADNVVLRDVIGNKTDTAESGDSIVSLVKGAVALSSTVDQTGTLSYLDAGGEQTVIELTPTTRKIIAGIWLDLVNMTQDGTIKLYYKIDGANYREFTSQTFTVATDSDGTYINLNMGITSDFKVTYTEGADEGAARDLPYQIILENKE